MINEKIFLHFLGFGKNVIICQFDFLSGERLGCPDIEGKS